MSRGSVALCRELAASSVCEVVGVGPDATDVTIAWRQSPDLRFYQLGVRDPPDAVLADYPDGFDVVLSTEVIGGLYSPRQLVAFACAALRGNRHLILTTPHHGYLRNRAIPLATGGIAPPTRCGMGGHIKLGSRKAITCLLTDAGLGITHFGGTGRVPYLWKNMVVVDVMQ